MKKKSKAKTIIIIVLAVLLVVESCVLIFGRKGGVGETLPADPVNGEIDTSNVTTQEDIVVEADEEALLKKILGDTNIGDTLRGVLYSNSIVSALMSAVYPMLYNELNNGGMLDFGPSIHLYPTGPQLAEQMGDVSYTAVDKDGVRKPLTDVLKKVGSNWDYMNTDVKWTDENGEEHSGNIYNSIDWMVHDQNSFYQAMNDATLGFRGLLEISVQSRTGVVTIDIIEFALKIDSFPLPINLDAATITNKSNVTGYQAFFVYLFNLLGLVDGEYPSSQEACGYNTMGELWKGIIESVIYAVEKIIQDPAQNIANVLMNLVSGIDSGTFVARMRMMHMFGEYHPLAKMAMGMEDSEVFNLGNTLIGVIEDMGIKLTGSWNDLLSSIISMVGGEDAKLPRFNTAGFLGCGTPTTLPNGNRVYKANPDKVVGFFVDYLMQGEVLQTLLNGIGLFEDKDNARIVKAFNQADEGISNFLKVVFSVVLKNLV